MGNEGNTWLNVPVEIKETELTMVLYNEIYDSVERKCIIKGPMGVLDVALALFTTANQRFSRFVHNVCLSSREKSSSPNWLSRSLLNYNPLKLQ
jgi:hypothetical protein